MPKTIKRCVRKTAKSVKKRQTRRYKRGGIRFLGYKLSSSREMYMIPIDRAEYLYKKFNNRKSREMEKGDIDEIESLIKQLKIDVQYEKPWDQYRFYVSINNLNFLLKKPEIKQNITSDDAIDILGTNREILNNGLLHTMYQRKKQKIQGDPELSKDLKNYKLNELETAYDVLKPEFGKTISKHDEDYSIFQVRSPERE